MLNTGGFLQMLSAGLLVLAAHFPLAVSTHTFPLKPNRFVSEAITTTTIIITITVLWSARYEACLYTRQATAVRLAQEIVNTVLPYDP